MLSRLIRLTQFGSKIFTQSTWLQRTVPHKDSEDSDLDQNTQKLLAAQVIPPQLVCSKERIHALARIYDTYEARNLIRNKALEPRFLWEEFKANHFSEPKTWNRVAKLASLYSLPTIKLIVNFGIINLAQVDDIILRYGYGSLVSAYPAFDELLVLARWEVKLKLISRQVITPATLAARYFTYKTSLKMNSELTPSGAVKTELFDLRMLCTQEQALALIEQGIIKPSYLAKLYYFLNSQPRQAVEALATLSKLCAQAKAQDFSCEDIRSFADAFLESIRKKTPSPSGNKLLAEASRFIGGKSVREGENTVSPASQNTPVLKR